MKIIRMIKFKKRKVNQKFYGYSGSSYDLITDGAIVDKIHELCDKHNATIRRISLTDESSWGEQKDCIIKIFAHKKDFLNIVNEFSLYFVKWISDIKY